MYYLHHLEATAGGTLRYIEYLHEGAIPGVHFLLFDRGQQDMGRFSNSKNATVVRCSRNSVLRYFQVLFASHEFIRSQKPAVVHAHSSISGFVVRVLQPFLKYECIYTPHCYSFLYPHRAFLKPIYWVIEKTFAKFNCALIHVSQSDAKTGEALGGKASHRVIPSPFSSSIQQVDPDRAFQNRNILVAGSFRQQKRYEFLTRIQLHLDRMGGGLKIVVLGAGKKIHGVNCLPWQEDLNAHYLNAFCLLNVSYAEGASLAIIDALRAGLPAVAFRVPGNSELLADGRGLLCNEQEPLAMAKLLRWLFRNRNAYMAIHAESVKYALKYYSPSQFQQNYAKLYNWSRAIHHSCLEDRKPELQCSPYPL